MAGNGFLAQLLELMEKRLRWYFAPVATLRGRASWDEHAALLDALEAGNGDLAAALTRHHCESTAAMYGSRPSPASG